MAPAAQPVSDIGISVLLAYQGFVRALHADLAAHGFDDVGKSDGLVFRLLSDRSRTVSELAGLLEVSKQGAGQIIQDMETRGYVVRDQSPGDARARPVRLSDRGLAALAAARRFHRRTEARLLREHGRESVATFRAVLTAMAGDDATALDQQVRGLYF
ncbi:MAG TPA: MarR family transcriptional regulator [Dermatophilaceae bacterium]|jgi:DNA-binding MarR family transcriptional regulator|nr:MarR family transcriptional regulator [Dermatophilaceae bacterium]HPZ68020.1 MarR family transcriptional regulator [Dermatophilaceae bacterium]HQD01237.1 MarR family transcriptional regulator [Dermatophilaceae bacterium]